MMLGLLQGNVNARIYLGFLRSGGLRFIGGLIFNFYILSLIDVIDRASYISVTFMAVIFSSLLNLGISGKIALYGKQVFQGVRQYRRVLLFCSLIALFFVSIGAGKEELYFFSVSLLMALEMMVQAIIVRYRLTVVDSIVWFISLLFWTVVLFFFEIDSIVEVFRLVLFQYLIRYLVFFLLVERHLNNRSRVAVGVEYKLVAYSLLKSSTQNMDRVLVGFFFGESVLVALHYVKVILEPAKFSYERLAYTLQIKIINSRITAKELVFSNFSLFIFPLSVLLGLCFIYFILYYFEYLVTNDIPYTPFLFFSLAISLTVKAMSGYKNAELFRVEKFGSLILLQLHALVLFVILLVIMFQMGVQGLSVSVLIASLLQYFVTVYVVRRLT